MRDKWNVKKKGNLKIHISVNVKTKEILSIMATGEHVHDSEMLPKSIETIERSKNTIVICKAIVD